MPDTSLVCYGQLKITTRVFRRIHLSFRSKSKIWNPRDLSILWTGHVFGRLELSVRPGWTLRKSILSSLRAGYPPVEQVALRLQRRCSVRTPTLLLDCNSRKIDLCDERLEFLALSYVWGPVATFESVSKCGEPLAQLPRVVEDAILVTKALGYRYLWIDRLCVPRVDADQLQAELRNMAYIYEAAEVTIIAAAGQDAEHGLPGVGHTSRPSRSTVVVGRNQNQLVSTGPMADVLIKQSKWRTRAWTYQEEFAARRRLYFTSHQVFFECSKLQAWDTVGYFQGLSWGLGPLETTQVRHFKKQMVDSGGDWECTLAPHH